MSRRHSFFAYAALIVGVISFASSFARPLIGQQAAQDRPAVGRFQIAVCGEKTGRKLFVIDTATGRTWSAYDEGGKTEWREFDNLPYAK